MGPWEKERREGENKKPCIKERQNPEIKSEKERLKIPYENDKEQVQ
jgi:hypothetical protein